jgi:hypothetical protein
MDAPGIRRDQQQLGYLVGRGFHRRSDADTVANSDSNSDAHANSDSNAHANSDSNAHANSDSDSDAYAYAYAKPDAVTHSNGDTHPNADGDADPYSDTFADPNAITVADCDAHADADGRRHDAPGWQSRHLLSRLVGASGGTPPYLVYVSAGALLRGLALNTFSGDISGTPGVAGTSRFTIRVTDRGHESVSRAFQISIIP